MSTAAPEPVFYVPAPVGTPPAPGEESAGPSTSPLVIETMQALRAELALFRQAQLEARKRVMSLFVPGQTDANGDAALELYTVPGGSTGYLTWLAVDEAGVTPGAPDTSGTLWHAILGLQAGVVADESIIERVGTILDCQPASPLADAQIPSVYSYGSKEACPVLVGPATFWFVIDAATASRQVGVRFSLVLETPEP